MEGAKRESPASSRRGLYGRGLVPGWVRTESTEQASQSGTRQETLLHE